MTEHRAPIRRVLAVVLALLLTVSGCAAIPDSSTPRVIPQAGRDAPPAHPAPTPRPDAAPEVVVRDFLKANAVAADNYAASRKFLVSSGASNWQVPVQAAVVERIDVIPDERTSDLTRLTIRAHAVGTLDALGVLAPVTRLITQNVQLQQVGGQWRIQGISSVGDTPMLVIDSDEFRTVYNRHLLYYPDPTGRTLVPDPRWVDSPRKDLPGDLMALLARGPRPSLRDAVYNLFGDAATVRGAVTAARGDEDADPGHGYAGVRVDFDGIGKLQPDQAKLLAAQVVWTLADADVQGPYQINSAGSAIDAQFAAGWGVNDVAAVNPRATSTLSVGLHAVLDGNFVKVTGTAVTPVPGPLGTLGTIRSVGMSDSGKEVAAVLDTAPAADTEQRVTLAIGGYGEVPTRVISAQSLTRPSWAPDDASVWIVVDDEKAVRIRRDRVTGEITQIAVDTAAVGAVAAGPITELRLSRDGVRAVMIVGGRVVVGIVQSKSNGQPMIAHPIVLTTDRDMAATAVDWRSGDSFFVGRNTIDSPIMQVTCDLSNMSPLPSSNLSPPVTAVTASPSNVYVTDSSGVWKIALGSGANSQYWSQVDRLAGGRAVPVLPG